MKAVLNKKFDLLVSCVDFLWSKREEIKKEDLYFDYPEYLGYGKAAIFNSNTTDAIYDGIECMKNGIVKTKFQFFSEILDRADIYFYSEFVKKITY